MKKRCIWLVCFVLIWTAAVATAENHAPEKLTIRGYFAAFHEDDSFQQLHPGVKIEREVTPSLTARDVREAIENGDATDLYYVCLDGELAGMFEEGLIAPLSSPLLQKDADGMLAVVQSALKQNGRLYAVPGMTVLTGWKSQEVTPNCFQALLAQDEEWNGETPYIGHSWAEKGWNKKDYADFLLTTFLSAQKKSGQHDRWSFAFLR